MKKTITETKDIFSPSNFEGTLGDLSQKVEELIKQYGKDARLNYDKYFAYRYDNECTPSFEVLVNRQETDEEYQNRLQEENDYKKKIEEKERAEFERLSQKYGDKK